jgi:hypothetical protein
MTEAVWAAAFSRRRGFRQVSVDDIVKAARGQRSMGCPHGEADDAACTLGASVAQVVRDRIAHAWLERQRLYS